MSTKTIVFCDKCNKDISVNSPRYIVNYMGKDTDLCSECFKIFSTFLKIFNIKYTENSSRIHKQIDVAILAVDIEE